MVTWGILSATPAGYKIDQTSQITQADGLTVFWTAVHRCLLIQDLRQQGSISNLEHLFFSIQHFCFPLSNAEYKCALPCFSTDCTIQKTVIHTFDYAIPICDFSNWPEKRQKKVSEFSGSGCNWILQTQTVCLAFLKTLK